MKSLEGREREMACGKKQSGYFFLLLFGSVSNGMCECGSII